MNSPNKDSNGHRTTKKFKKDKQKSISIENSYRGLDGCYCNPDHSNKLSKIKPEQESKALLDRKNSQLGKIMKSRSSLVENKAFNVPF